MTRDRKTTFYIIPAVLFYAFLAIFLLTAILSLLAVFFGIGVVSERQRDVLLSVLLLEVSGCIIAMFRSVFSGRATATPWDGIYIHPRRTSVWKHIAPLKSIEQRFLQVLVSGFRVRHEGPGVHLEVEFANDALAIWTDSGKREMESRFAADQDAVDELQKTLTQVLITRDKVEYTHPSDGNPFRYASGGALPIVTIGETRYYCLIYREIPPIGWNIANGGCDSRDELLNPANAILRELNEELIIIDPEAQVQYFYQKFHDLPDHNMVREYLRRQQLLPGLCKHLRFEDALTSFELGPDTLTINITHGAMNEVPGCYVNINAIDSGIELDKVAHIRVGENAIFIDGEIARYHPRFDIVNAPIGLFEITGFEARLRSGSQRFIPDVFYWSARRYPADVTITPAGIIAPAMSVREVESSLADRIAQFVETRQGAGGDCSEFVRRHEKGDIYDLCPVTRSLAMRYLQSRRVGGQREPTAEGEGGQGGRAG